MSARQLVATVLLAGAATGQAETRSTTVLPQPLTTTQNRPVAELAAQWGLTPSEWQSYQQIMRDRRGIWSPGLDPITALGVSADSAEQRTHYAELYVRTEFERTRKELAFQLAVDAAWSRLYPATPRLDSRAVAGEPGVGATRYALIVTPECAACTSLLQQRMGSLIEEAEEGVDVHVVGMADDDDALRQWIATQPTLVAALKRGRATVNHGDQFQHLGRFPAIYSKTRGGQWAREL